jgi:hypothetical protein
MDIINKIFNNNFNILDIEDKVGDTDYLDFIKPENTKYSIMKDKNCF